MGARQVEAFTAEEMKGRPCVFDWVDQEKQDLERVARELYRLGWLVGTHRHGWYVAFRRPKVVGSKLGEVIAITPTGLLRKAEAVERRIQNRKRRKG